VTIAAVNVMVTAVAMAVVGAMSTAAAIAALKWLSSWSEAAVGLSAAIAVVWQCWLMVVVAMVSLPWQ
jgi:hypothetical protein